MPNIYISSFLIALSFFVLNTDPVRANDTTPLELIHAQGCKGCHFLNNSGGVIGPKLNDIGKRLSRKQILQKLIKNKTVEPSSTMPDFRHMTEQDLLRIADYLYLQQ